MKLVHDRDAVVPIRAALIDPPLGFVTVEFADDTLALVFANGARDETPRSAAQIISRDGHQLVIHWAGTAIMLSFAIMADLIRMEEALGGLDNPGRTFTFMVTTLQDEPELAALGG